MYIDLNFYSINRPFKVQELVEIMDCALESNSFYNFLVTGISHKIQEAAESEIVFLFKEQEIKLLKNIKSKICVIHYDYLNAVKVLGLNLCILLSKDPYYSYAKIVSLFYKPIEFKQVKSWINHNKIEIGLNSVVHHTAIIGEKTTIGVGVFIGHGVKIGRNCVIRNNVCISYAIIGDNVTIDSGTVIGEEGFGFINYNNNIYTVPHVGRVIIGNNVRISSNSVIDRGYHEDTVIGNNTLIDSLVKIAHNVRIGERCIILGQVGIAGGTILGNKCLVAGQAGIADYITIGNEVSIAARSLVTKDIASGLAVAGIPAVPINEWRKQIVFNKKLLNQSYKT